MNARRFLCARPGSVLRYGSYLRSNIRHFSKKSHFPANTVEFAQAIKGALFTVRGIDGEVNETGQRHLNSIRRYFNRFGYLMRGWKTGDGARKVRHGGGGGGHPWRHGYIPLYGPSIFNGPVRQELDDPVLSVKPGMSIVMTPEDDLASLEDSGLAPADAMEEVFALCTEKEMKSRIFGAELRDQARETAAQHLPFAQNNLTEQEVRQVNQLACEWIAFR